MMRTLQSRLSFVVMAVLVFIGLHLLLVTWVSTGPNTDLSLGWLALQRHGLKWTIQSFHPEGLIAVALISVLATWVLSKMLRRGSSQS